MIAALVLLPALAGALAFFLPRDGARRALLLAAAAAHAAMTAFAWVVPPGPLLHGWLGLDALGLLFASITSALFLAVSVSAVWHLAREPRVAQDAEDGVPFTHTPEATFTGCLLLFLSAMTLVAASQHFGLLWVGVEATTLASAPLIHFHRHHRSLEAMWKYLLICSVGIAIALLGTFFLALAAAFDSPGPTSLALGDLIRGASALHPAWLRAAFLLLLVGYGTKMGLAPLHTWLPDAHSEAPSVVSALLSGALLNCAFLGLIRATQVCIAAGHGPFAQGLLVDFGLISMAFAAVFIVSQTDYKRLLAYSSVEHMGILALGIGLGGAATFGAMLHAVSHSLAKAALFLVAGNILAAYRTKAAGQVSGALRVLPISGALWVGALLAITGTPPSGIFLSEFTILSAAVAQGHFVVAGLFLLLLSVIFIGMITPSLRMAQGPPPSGWRRATGREAWAAVGPPLVLGAAVVVLGLVIPSPLSALLHSAARALGGL